MATEQEKTFFDTFGIEPKYKDYRTKNGKEYECKNPNNRNIRLCYPQITDKNYLELICLLNKLIDEKYGEYEIFVSFNYKNLKEEILDECLLHREELKHQVQAIFEGER